MKLSLEVFDSDLKISTINRLRWQVQQALENHVKKGNIIK